MNMMNEDRPFSEYSRITAIARIFEAFINTKHIRKIINRNQGYIISTSLSPKAQTA